MVHEVQHTDQVCIFHTLEIEQRMLVPVSPKDSAEEGGAGTEDHLVGLQLLVLTGQGDIKEVFVFTQLTEG